jgi:hypothetical protein
MSLFVGDQMECYCKMDWENVYTRLEATPFSDSTTSNFSAGSIYMRLLFYRLIMY